jgi:alkanesulfonate monooxygenase SsuD/methylene tetrahydromethanopterin reductase-like flavin-dependent oxidoreductase (luciferase family)
VKIVAVLAPVAEWAPVLAAAEAAERAGLAGISLWDHYHSGRPEWGYGAGWSAYGAIAARTTRVRMTPMVLNNLHYDIGVLAKESSVLSIASGGRFELGIGGGDWPESFAAWGAPFPAAAERTERLVETIAALREIWSGAPVTYDGRHVRLLDAICTPPPPAPPRVVVGVGKSRRVLDAVAALADEYNVYADAAVVADARQVAAAQERPVSVSVFFSWEWDKWPADPAGELAQWRERGVDRCYVSIGSAEMPERIASLAAAQGA